MEAIAALEPKDAADLVVAIGTVVLAIATAYLAIYTKRLADVTVRPSVVVTLEPSPRALMYFDIHVENEGTAAAYDVQVSFDPEVERENDSRSGPFPLSRVSMLKAGQKISSSATSYALLEGKTFTAIISWTRKPGSKKREHLSYTLDMGSFAGISRFEEPIHQIANDLKKGSEALDNIARGWRRVGVDVYDSDDRTAEAEAHQKRHAEFLARHGGAAAPASIEKPPRRRRKAAERDKSEA